MQQQCTLRIQKFQNRCHSIIKSVLRSNLSLIFLHHFINIDDPLIIKKKYVLTFSPQSVSVLFPSVKSISFITRKVETLEKTGRTQRNRNKTILSIEAPAVSGQQPSGSNINQIQHHKFKFNAHAFYLIKCLSSHLTTENNERLRGSHTPESG